MSIDLNQEAREHAPATGLGYPMFKLKTALEHARSLDDKAEIARLESELEDLIWGSGRLIWDADAAQERGDWAENLRCWKEIANLRDDEQGIRACFLAGSFSLERDDPEHQAEGVRYLKAALRAGDTAAIVPLAEAYSSGRGVEREPAEAFRLFQLALDGDDATAHYDIGAAYWEGLGVEQDYGEAIRHLRLYLKEGGKRRVLDLANYRSAKAMLTVAAARGVGGEGKAGRAFHEHRKSSRNPFVGSQVPTETAPPSRASGSKVAHLSFPSVRLILLLAAVATISIAAILVILKWNSLRLPAQVAIVALAIACGLIAAIYVGERFWRRFRHYGQPPPGYPHPEDLPGYIGERFPDDDFDVGPLGFSGHYDQMLAHFRDNSASALVVVGLWCWVLFWPRGTALFDITPQLSAADLIVLALMVCSAEVVWLILVGGFWGARWLSLEKRGLYTFIRNGHVVRIVHYRREDDRLLFDEMTQADRMNEEYDADHAARETLASEVLQLAQVLVGFPLLAVALAVLPNCFGQSFARAVDHFTLDDIAAIAKSFLPQFSTWLMRRDVHGILAPITLQSLTLWLYFWVGIIPQLTNFGWTIFATIVRWRGFQYIPGAKVLEGSQPPRTIEDIRGEDVHGRLDFEDPDQGAFG